MKTKFIMAAALVVTLGAPLSVIAQNVEVITLTDACNMCIIDCVKKSTYPANMAISQCAERKHCGYHCETVESEKK